MVTSDGEKLLFHVDIRIEESPAKAASVDVFIHVHVENNFFTIRFPFAYISEEMLHQNCPRTAVIVQCLEVSASLVPVGGPASLTLAWHVGGDKASLLLACYPDKRPDIATKPSSICTLGENIATEWTKKHLSKSTGLASIPSLVHIVGSNAFAVTTHTNSITKLFSFIFDGIKMSLCFNDMTSVNVVTLEEFQEFGDLAALAIKPAEAVGILTITTNHVVRFDRGNVTNSPLYPILQHRVHNILFFQPSRVDLGGGNFDGLPSCSLNVIVGGGSRGLQEGIQGRSERLPELLYAFTEGLITIRLFLMFVGLIEIALSI